MEKAIILLSGGMNSAVAAASLAETHELYMLFVGFQQRPQARELDAYESLCQHFQPKRRWRAELSHFKQVGGNALVEQQRELQDALALPRDVADTYVAALMPTMLDVAVSFAYRINAGLIVTGMSEALHEPGPGVGVMYPDHRREFIYNYQYMIDAALPPRSRLTVEAPLIDFTRAEAVKLGVRLGVPFESTWSCYEPHPAPCGRCFGCANRASGFLQACVADPLILPASPA